MGDYLQAEECDPPEATRDQPRHGSGADVENPRLKHPAWRRVPRFSHFHDLLILLCVGRDSVFSGPSIAFWINTYGSFRGFTLITGLPRGFSLLPIKGRSDALEEIEKILFSAVFSLTQRGRFLRKKGGFPLGEEGSPPPRCRCWCRHHSHSDLQHRIRQLKHWPLLPPVRFLGEGIAGTAATVRTPSRRCHQNQCPSSRRQSTSSAQLERHISLLDRHQQLVFAPHRGHHWLLTALLGLGAWLPCQCPLNPSASTPSRPPTIAARPVVDKVCCVCWRGCHLLPSWAALSRWSCHPSRTASHRDFPDPGFRRSTRFPLWVLLFLPIRSFNCSTAGD